MTTILKPLVDILRALALLLAAAVGLLGLSALGGAFSDRLDVLAHFAPIWLGGGVVAALLWAVSGRRGRTTPALALVAALASLILMIPELTAAATQKHVKAGGETLTLVQFMSPETISRPFGKRSSTLARRSVCCCCGPAGYGQV